MIINVMFNPCTFLTGISSMFGDIFKINTSLSITIVRSTLTMIDVWLTYCETIKKECQCHL